MKSTRPAIEVTRAAEKWLQADNQALKRAIDQTIEEGLFGVEDIEHQLRVLRENVYAGQIEEWAGKAGLSGTRNVKGKKVLCLHAGNLPLVGFQTALGTLLSGADYFGKLSRKDPYLLASFLEEVKKAGLSQSVEYSTDLNHFKNLGADMVVFAGSQESVPQVKAEIKKLKAAKTDAEYLIRTAKFSIAYIDEWDAGIARELAEAMLRYGGNGCRSVAVVVTGFGLKEAEEELARAIKSFWEENPQHKEPGPGLKYQFAYNKAVGRPQIWLDNFLIQETQETPKTEFTVNWVNGDEEKVKELRMNFGEVIQSVYTTGVKIEGLETEPLSQAQQPPLWWKPDGMDIIQSLCEEG